MMPTNLKIELLPIGTIKPYVNNPKLHPEEHVKQIASSITHFGFNDPIALDENSEIIEGHGRYSAALILGLKKIPVIYLKHLSPAQRKAYALVHNKLTMNTGFDLELLKMEFEVLHEMQNTDGFDWELELTGFEKYEIDELLNTDFEPTDQDSQSRLDEKKKVECPECGHEFEPK